MLKAPIRRLVPLLLPALLILIPPAVHAAERLTILHLNDFHGSLLPCIQKAGQPERAAPPGSPRWSPPSATPDPLPGGRRPDAGDASPTSSPANR